MGIDSKHHAACKEVLDLILGAKDGRRSMANVFKVLPNRDMWPDYYQAIPEPQSLEGIKTRMETGQFPSAAEMLRCLHLVFLNAKHYNEDGSPIFDDAETLEGLLMREWTTRAEQGALPYPPGMKPSKRQAPVKVPTPAASPAEVASPLPSVSAPSRGRKRKIESPPPQVFSPPPVTALSPIKEPTPAPLPQRDVTPPPLPPPPKQISPYITLPIRPADLPPPLTGSEADQQIEDAKMIAALERKLEKWSGPQEAVGGWFGQGMPNGVNFAAQSSVVRTRGILHALVEYRDATGLRLSDTLAQVGEASNLLHLSYSHPLSLALLRERAEAGNFASLVEFDMEMTRFFEKARRWFPPYSIPYGHILTLQRMYSELTCPQPPLVRSDGTLQPSSTAFAGLPAGPGNARSFHETNQQMRAGAAPEEVGHGLTTFRVGTRNRIFLEEARWKGVAYRLGDYVHIINPDDPTRPTIGQIYRTYIPDKAPGRLFATICWYYRPEQTVHPANRQFYENEIFKTGHFADHPIEDILERVTCQFFTKFVRGRSHPPEYYPGWTIYICNSRYNDRDDVFVRIKNWGSCIPEELRKTNFMAVAPFPSLLQPRMISSPFLRGAQGPGCTGYLGEGGGDGEDEAEMSKKDAPKRDRQAEKMRHLSRDGPGFSLPSTQFHQPYTAAEIPTPPLYTPPVPPPQQSAVSNVARPPQQAAPLAPSVHRGNVDRSIAGLVGGTHNLAQLGHKENLPREMKQLLDRDPVSGQVLWFSAPPAAPGSLYIPEQPAHSLEYLAHLSKRKMGNDQDGGSQKPCRYTVSEAIADDGDEVARWASAMQTFIDEEPISDEATPRNQTEKTPEEMARALRDLVDSLV